ncbi:MAG TPA: RluA family pseudouridine synthase [Candidatus Saccharimonadia bacterium]|nr:RluA family pseudouridine synthase [Candidatus Saccharimonadia bacterium]
MEPIKTQPKLNDSSAPVIPILFEDDNVVVIDKPAGIVVNRAESVKESTLQDWAEVQPWFWKGSMDEGVDLADADLIQIYRERSGMAHRLDKDTSGTMIFAKNPTALAELMRQFREREIEKTYIALVHGKFGSPNGTIRLPLGRSQNDRERFTVDPDGKMSETQYEVVEFYPTAPKWLGGKKTKSYQGFSLVRLHPKTGRTHQIRVHMGYLKHPLVGDLRYVGRKRSKVDGDWVPRQFLHAEKVSFINPKSKERIQVLSPLAPDLQKVLDQLI